MNFVQPIKDKKDIAMMKEYFHKQNLRNYTLFTFGINSLLRVSDLLNLQLSDVIFLNGKLKDKKIIREQKTNKVKEFPFNVSIISALNEYMSNYHNHKDSCLFPSQKWLNQEDLLNRRSIVDFLDPHIKDLVPQIKQYKSIEEIAVTQKIDLKILTQKFTELFFTKLDKEVEKEKNEDKKKSKHRKVLKIKSYTPQQIQFLLKVEGHDPIGRGRVHDLIKKAGNIVGIKENISTHSMRKTAAYNIYINNEDDPKVIDYLQFMLNHGSRAMVLRYLGITQDIINNIYLDNPL